MLKSEFEEQCCDYLIKKEERFFYIIILQPVSTTYSSIIYNID